MTQKKFYFGRGKVLLSGEYFVIDGALALALPCKLGQQMSVDIATFNGASLLHWKAYDSSGNIWFEGQFSPKKYHIIESTDKGIATELQTILRAVRPHHEDFIPENKVTTVTTELDFSTQWGLGASSTLIYMLSKWAKMNPFSLLKDTFGGSGYDIACASAEQPILYQLVNNVPHWETIDFYPPFAEQLYFIYLGKKQSSRKGIHQYRKIVKTPQKYTHLFSEISKSLLEADALSRFEQLLLEHENLVAKILKMERSQDLYFQDYSHGIIKSLGAWGGDFVLATSNASKEETQKYFNSKGFNVVLPYKKLIV